MKVSLCICTFRRASIADTLASVDALDLPEGVTLEVIVADNDGVPSGRELIERTAAGMRIPVRYVHAPKANISIARNAGLDAAEGDWVAMLDDDEVVGPDWLAALLRRQAETGADGVFGHSHARYGADAPAWIVAGNYHSQIQIPRAGQVETGHTCNALLRWGDAPWRGERFDIGHGTSGGEDTEFFFRLRRMGARYAISDDAIAYEPVAPERLAFGWLCRRKYRIGQSYSTSAIGLPARLALIGTAGTKAAFCGAMALAHAVNPDKRNFWILRGVMHAGVCHGCLSLPKQVLYGKD